MRITRPFVLLALAVMLAPHAEASRTSVWERNPPASLTAPKADAAGLLASLAPSVRLGQDAAAAAETTEQPLFKLGDVILAECELEREERFNLGSLTLVDLNLLRGPPPSYPETRVKGLELLPPFRIGASPSLSLWGRQAYGFSCGEVVSDSRYDPWGLAVSAARGGIVISDERSVQGETFGVTYDWAQANPDAFYGLLTDVGGMDRSEADAFIGDHQLGLTGGARRQQLARMVSKDTDDLIQEVKREWVSQAKWGAAGYGAGKLIAGAYRGVRGVLQFGDELGEAAAAGLDDAGNAIRESGANWQAPARVGRLEQGRDARGRFLPLAEGQSAPGAERALRVQQKLEGRFGAEAVQREQYLRNADGSIAMDPISKEGRRLDFVIVGDGRARYAVEVTSKRASKGWQLAKERSIRGQAEVFVLDRSSGKLVSVADVPTRLIRVR